MGGNAITKKACRCQHRANEDDAKIIMSPLAAYESWTHGHLDKASTLHLHVVSSGPDYILFEISIKPIPITHTMTLFDTSRKEAVWKHCEGKGEIACTSNYSFSHNVFYSMTDRYYNFCYKFCCLQMLSIWTSLKFDVWEWVNNYR